MTISGLIGLNIYKRLVSRGKTYDWPPFIVVQKHIECIVLCVIKSQLFVDTWMILFGLTGLKILYG
jgi:hypothetical protein